MKKTIILAFIFTLLFIFIPAFFVNVDEDENIKNIETINQNSIKSNYVLKTGYIIDVDISKKHMTIYKNNKVLKEIVCDTEKDNHSTNSTPIGNFQVENKGSFFFNSKYKKNERHYIKFFSNYLIHSIPTDKNGTIIEEGKNKLELPVSKGCIEVSEKDSKWLYDNIPVGTEVVIN